MWMAAFTRETQLGMSAEIIEMCGLDTTARIVDLDLRSNPRQSVATIYGHLPCRRGLIAFSFQSGRRMLL
jgi:hypothetical protein